MREDIYKKEREIYDLKNQHNLINLRLTKENESKASVVDALQNNNERYANDVDKYCTNLKGSVSDNESLAIKLQETDKEL